MKPTKKQLMIFALIMAIGLGIAWVSGYNFDHRDEQVGVGMAAILMVAFFMAILFND